jgi:DNA-binding IclR family transcriptional regulator
MSAGSSTLHKGLDLLKMMGRYPTGAPASVFARESGLPFSTAYRLLNTLVTSGFAEYEAETKLYRPGLAVFELSANVTAARGYDGIVLPILQQLSATTNESCLFAVRDGLESLTIRTVDGPDFRQTTDPGDRLPLHVSAMGKAILAGMPHDDAAALISEMALEARTAHTVTDPTELLAQIEAGRQDGYVYQREEVDEGMHAIGVPIMSQGQTVLGSLAIAAPLFRASEQELIAHQEALAAAARQLADMLPALQSPTP